MTTPSTGYRFRKANYQDFVNDVKSFDPNDASIEQKVIDSAMRNGVHVGDMPHTSESSHHGELIRRHHYNPFENFFEDLIPFRHGFRNMFDMFERQFEDININPDWSDLEKEFPKEEVSKEDVPTYGKYVHSYSTYDADGRRKSKSVSGVEKVIKGKHYVSKKIKTEDESGVHTKHVLPDGSIRETYDAPKVKSIDDK